MQLRPYQRECVDRTFEAFGQYRSVLNVAATGTGKTVSSAHIFKRFLESTEHHGMGLAIAHREELIYQARDKFSTVLGDKHGIEIEMADQKAMQGSGLLHGTSVVVASVQSLSQRSRLKRYDPMKFGLLWIDEAHHLTKICKTYNAVVEHFSRNPDLRIFGSTATPDRADEIALGEMFEHCSFDYGAQQAILEGWLVPIRQHMAIIEGLDFSAVKVRMGDLSEGEVEKIMLEEKALHRVVSVTVEAAGERPTMVFCAGVAQAHATAEILNRHRPDSAVAMDGTTDKDERRRQLRRFAAGEFQYLVNCALYLEGFDEPRVACIANARPTKSRALYAQILGRGTRTLPGIVDGVATAEERSAAIAASGKKNCVVIDFVGNSGRHKLVHAADVLGGICSDEVLERAKRKTRERAERGEESDVMTMLDEAKQEEEDRIEWERKDKRRGIVAKAQFRLREIDPFDLFDSSVSRTPGYVRHTPASDKQKYLLKKNGVPNVDKLSQSQASRLIDEVQRRRQEGLATPGQIARLASFGRTIPSTATFADAASAIQEINRELREGVSK